MKYMFAGSNGIANDGNNDNCFVTVVRGDASLASGFFFVILSQLCIYGEGIVVFFFFFFFFFFRISAFKTW